MSGVVLHLYKRPDGGLWPADEESTEYTKKLTVGEVIGAGVRKARNYKFHKKFFALLKVGFDNQDKYTSPEAFREEVTIRAGWYTTHLHLDGSASLHAKSISFGRMDELEFEKLYSAAIDVILHKFVAGMSEAALRQAVAEEIVRFAA